MHPCQAIDYNNKKKNRQGRCLGHQVRHGYSYSLKCTRNPKTLIRLSVSPTRIMLETSQLQQLEYAIGRALLEVSHNLMSSSMMQRMTGKKEEETTNEIWGNNRIKNVKQIYFSLKVNVNVQYESSSVSQLLYAFSKYF